MAGNAGEDGITASEYDEANLSKQFDEAFKLFRNINDFEGETTSTSFQDKVQRGIVMCEKLTVAVSAIDMFSSNESAEEIPTNHIKFLLLPFLLGKFWQWKTDKERKDVCEASNVYFRDFLQRLFDYGILSALPAVMENEEDKQQGAPSSYGNDLRSRKIALLKENKALEIKIKTILDRQEANEDVDEDTVRELYLSIIQRSKNEAVAELESITKEMELIKYSLKMKEDRENGDARAVEPAPQPKTSGIQTFILTRNVVEKQVFGLGYPALPVMTVEELYEQRRAEGIWGPPGASNANQPPPGDPEEAEAEANEVRDEADDPERLQQLRNMDEYKDMHRRGWGNRFNRS